MATRTTRENTKKDNITETVAQTTSKWWYWRRAIRRKAEKAGVNNRVPLKPAGHTVQYEESHPTVGFAVVGLTNCV